MQVFLTNFVAIIFLILWLLVFGRVLISWFDPTGRSQLAAFLIQATEPMLAPIRRVLPPAGMFDFAPLILIVIFGLIWRSFL